MFPIRGNAVLHSVFKRAWGLPILVGLMEVAAFLSMVGLTLTGKSTDQWVVWGVVVGAVGAGGLYFAYRAWCSWVKRGLGWSVTPGPMILAGVISLPVLWGGMVTLDPVLSDFGLLGNAVSAAISSIAMSLMATFFYRWAARSQSRFARVFQICLEYVVEGGRKRQYQVTAIRPLFFVGFVVYETLFVCLQVGSDPIILARFSTPVPYVMATSAAWFLFGAGSALLAMASVGLARAMSGNRWSMMTLEGRNPRRKSSRRARAA